MADLGGRGRRWLRELVLVAGDDPDRTLAIWRSGKVADDKDRAVSASIPGSAGWSLRGLICAGTTPGPNAFADLVSLLAMWHQARKMLAESEVRVVARSAELDLLQAIGRAAAEARAPETLFASVISVLERTEDFDVFLVGHVMPGVPETPAYVSRPFTDEYLDRLAGLSARFLGVGQSSNAVRRVETRHYDGARGEREEFREEDVVLLPLMRRGAPVACWVVVPSFDGGESQLRLLYSASNQVAMHLDRILTVREAEADRFRAIVDSMPQGVMLVDAGMGIVQTNHAAREMLALAGLEGSPGKADVIERLGLRPLVDRVRSQGRSHDDGEVAFDGDQVWSVTVSSIRDDVVGPDGFVVVLSDITDRRRMQQQLAQSEKMSSLGQLISGVAHELNNPLATLLGYAQLLRPRANDSKQARQLDILRREADRCRRIVHNLLSFARRREPESRPISLNEVVEQAVALLAYHMRVHDIAVHVDLSPELPAIRGDAHELQQVMVNLLTNAQQAIREVRERGTIKIRTAVAEGGGIALDVVDDGPGIPETARRRIFDPFFTTKPAGDGTGLGLSLVYGIVSAHGGKIEAVGCEPHGTMFQLHFPRDVERTAVAAPSPVLVGPPVTSSARILVVDDEEPVARLICDTLQEEGHLTRRACDGVSALKLVADDRFDLIIADFKMPGMDGDRLHDELRKVAPQLARRMILTTGDTLGAEPARLARRTGAEILPKPFDLDELRRRVRERLEPED